MNSIWTIWRRSVCAASGALAGAVAGMMLGLVDMSGPAASFSTMDLLKVGLFFGAIAWLAVLTVVGLWLHYGLRAVAFPSLLTSLITAVLTVFVGHRIHIPILDVWLGLLIGTLVGAAFCRLCGLRPDLAKGDSRGLR